MQDKNACVIRKYNEMWEDQEIDEETNCKPSGCVRVCACSVGFPAPEQNVSGGGGRNWPYRGGKNPLVCHPNLADLRLQTVWTLGPGSADVACPHLPMLAAATKSWALADRSPVVPSYSYSHVPPHDPSELSRQLGRTVPSPKWVIIFVARVCVVKTAISFG
jgi:hypothetical protein